MSCSVAAGTASAAGLPIANRTMSCCWLASSEVLESITEPTRSAARVARGSRVITLLRGQSTGDVGQQIRSVGSDEHRLRGLVAPPVHPHAEDDVERHTLLDHRLVLGPDAHRALAPVRWIADANRIADAGLLRQAV